MEIGDNLYYNTLLNGCVILSVYLSVCSFAIEITFPLSHFKTKNIFEILMERVQSSKPFGAPKAPQFFILFFYRSRRWRKLPPQVGCPGAPNMGRPWRPNYYPIFFHRRLRRRFSKWTPEAPQQGRRGCPKVAPEAPLPRRAREVPPKAGVSRVNSKRSIFFLQSRSRSLLDVVLRQWRAYFTEI